MSKISGLPGFGCFCGVFFCGPNFRSKSLEDSGGRVDVMVSLYIQTPFEEIFEPLNIS